MRIARGSRPAAFVSLVPMVDVLLIMLVFFMVTSTYLDLDMIPMAERRSDGASVSAAAGAAPAPLLLRIDADGGFHLRGRAMLPDALTAELARARDGTPGLQVLVFPSGQASLQALVTAMDAAAAAGVTQIRVIRLEPGP